MDTNTFRMRALSAMDLTSLLIAASPPLPFQGSCCQKTWERGLCCICTRAMLEEEEDVRGRVEGTLLVEARRRPDDDIKAIV